jgi:glycosyltransferase involved in cell wall biosynthesis
MADRTRALVERISEISPDALLCHAVGDRVDFNAIRYLPDSIHKILILHGSTLAIYRCARAVRDFVSATVAISPRIKQDLVSTYDFNESGLRFIPHGIDVAAFFKHPQTQKLTGPLRILSHGRIDKEQKGVFWLPGILAELDRQSKEWNCTISGDGPDLGELKRLVGRTGLSDRIQFTGWTPPGDVPGLLNEHDVFLFPSTYEGSPIALIEAMAAGCVPVASRLPGITDWIIQDGADGLLFPIGDVRRAAKHLLGLLTNRHRLNDLRKRSQERVRRCSLDWMTDQYYQLFCELQSAPRQGRPAEDLNKCHLAAGLKPAWWYGLPDPIKDRLRLMRERIRTVVKVP